MVAGVFTTGIMTPGERIKCLLQVCTPYFMIFLESLSPFSSHTILEQRWKNRTLGT